MNPRTKTPTATGQQRPTPLHPYPQPKPPEKPGDAKAYPPELGTDAIAILEGRTFMLSNSLDPVQRRQHSVPADRHRGDSRLRVRRQAPCGGYVTTTPA